jgi:hypothetical protein
VSLGGNEKALQPRPRASESATSQAGDAKAPQWAEGRAPSQFLCVQSPDVPPHRRRWHIAPLRAGEDQSGDDHDQHVASIIGLPLQVSGLGLSFIASEQKRSGNPTFIGKILS